MEKRHRMHWYLITALQPTQVSCFFANFIIPPVDGVDMEIALVWLPCRSSLLAFFKMGSNILNSGCNIIFLATSTTKFKYRYENVIWTNLAYLIFKVVLRIYGYIIFQHIYRVLRLLIGLILINLLVQTINATQLGMWFKNILFQITLAPLAAFIMTYGTRSPTFGAVAASRCK